MARKPSTAVAPPAPSKTRCSRRRRTQTDHCESARVVTLGVDSPRRRALGLGHLTISWSVRRDQVQFSREEWYRSQVDPELSGPLPSFRRSAKVPETIRPVREWNSDLFNELIASKPQFSDPNVKRFWSHLEATWEDAILGYRWRWPDRSPPYRVAITEAQIKRIIEQCKWVRTLRSS